VALAMAAVMNFLGAFLGTEVARPWARASSRAPRWRAPAG
jgi:hypothetical protein